MNKVEVTPFDFRDLDDFVLREYEQQTLTPERFASILNNCKCLSLKYKDLVLGVAGHFEVYPGTVEMFVIPSAYAPKFPHIYVRGVRRAMAGVIAGLRGAHRVQTFSVANSQTDKWMKALGFEWEGTLRHYMGKNVNYNCWARILK